MRSRLTDRITRTTLGRPPRPGAGRARTATTGRLRLALALGALVGSALAGTAGATSASGHASSSQSPLQQGLNFYRGKTITLDVPTASGAGFDIDTRFVTPVVGEYLHATVNIVDYPTGATIPGQDATAAADPNGLTIGLLETGTDAINKAVGLPGLNFNPEREVFLGGWPNTPGVVIDHVTDPYPSLLSLRKATAADPVKVLEIADNANSIQLNLVLKALGVNYRVISGYSNSQAEEAGWLRGDGQLVYVAYAGLLPFVKEGIARALGATTPEPPSFTYHQQLVGVPLFQTILDNVLRSKSTTPGERRAAQYAFEALNLPTTAFVAPSATPANRFLALRAAFKFALKSALVKSELSGRGEPAGYVAPQVEKANYVAAANKIEQVAAYAGA